MINSKIVENDFNQVYVVYRNGNVLVKVTRDIRPCLRCAKRLASKGVYVELCYYYSPGNYEVVKYWN